MHVHILGICGTLMGSIALLARQQGHKVSGSDENTYPPMSDQLEAADISITTPYSAANIPSDADLIIIGNANLPRGNPAVEHVLNNNLAYTSGAEWLGRYLLKDKWVIAVAGTHGKTTTTSMVAWILEYAGMKPGFLVGGIPSNFTESARLGETPFFVIEADEYDTSYFDRRSKFLHYHPRTVILNNLEYDHADIFDDLAAIQNQFHLLLRTIPSSGLIIHPTDDPNLNEVIGQGCWSEKFEFGAGGDLVDCDKSDDGSSFQVRLKDQIVGEIKWELTGNHNISNALAAISAARHVGVTPSIACQALSEFTGVKRRMEKIYTSSTLTVYDDFAHHPTAIASTLEGLRNSVGSAKVLAIIEPGSHTMRKGTHASQLKNSAGQADMTLWFKPLNLAWDIETFSDSNHLISEDIDELISLALTKAKEGYSHIVIMSNSGFGGLHLKLLDQLS